jgi:hypothetical protein
MPLTTDRNTPRREGDVRKQALAASILVFAGGILMRNAAGYLTKGATATGLIGVGVALEQVDNSDGSAGDKSVAFRAGIHRFKNSASGDAITIAEISDPCYAVDDETVAKTSGTNTRSLVGFVEDVDDQGVWVRFDEMMVAAYLAGITLPA